MPLGHQTHLYIAFEQLQTLVGLLAAKERSTLAYLALAQLLQRPLAAARRRSLNELQRPLFKCKRRHQQQARPLLNGAH